MKPRTKDDFRVAEEAANWLLRLEEDDSPQCHAEFLAWTKLSARNLHEFLFAKAVSEEMNGVDPEKRIDLSSLGVGPEDTVISLERDPAEQQSPVNALPASRVPVQTRTRAGSEAAQRSVSAAVGQRPRRTAWKWTAGLAATVLMAVSAGFLLQQDAGQTGTYGTAMGEQRTVKLADGSLIYLNTQSHVQVDYSAQRRDIRLLEGEALFVVAHDPRRPFKVAAGTTLVQALGTQFNVYRRPDNTTVAVVEGRVKISDTANKQSQEAAAGEEARVVASSGIEKQAATDIARRVAWRERRLVFRADRLSDVAAEFNRYNHRQIQIEGTFAAEREISGVFDADDPEPLVEFLTKDPQLAVETEELRITIRAR